MSIWKGELTISEVITSYKWEIPDFRQIDLPPGEKISTKFFTYFGCGSEESEVHWQINLFPRGVEAENQEFISIFLQMNNIPAKFDSSFSFSILNRKNERVCESEHYEDRKESCPSQDLNTTIKISRGCSEFIRRNVLLDESFDFLHDEKLIILCDINVKDFKPSGTVNRLRRLEQYEKLIDNKEYSDVLLVLDNNRIIYAHKNILANQSPVFDKLFSKEGKNRLLKIAVRGVSYRVVREMLRCMYAGSVLDMGTYCKLLLRLSHEFGIHRLKLMCAKHLAENINLYNMSDLLDLSVQYDLQQLRDEIIKFAVSNGKDLIGEDQFTEIARLNQGTVVDVLKQLMLDLV